MEWTEKREKWKEKTMKRYAACINSWKYCLHSVWYTSICYYGTCHNSRCYCLCVDELNGAQLIIKPISRWNILERQCEAGWRMETTLLRQVPLCSCALAVNELIWNLCCWCCISKHGSALGLCLHAINRLQRKRHKTLHYSLVCYCQLNIRLETS